MLLTKALRELKSYLNTSGEMIAWPLLRVLMTSDSIMIEIMTRNPSTPGSYPARHPSSNRLPKDVIYQEQQQMKVREYHVINSYSTLPDELVWKLCWRFGGSHICKSTHLPTHGWAQNAKWPSRSSPSQPFFCLSSRSASFYMRLSAGEPAYSGVHPTCLATTEESVLSPQVQWMSWDNSDLVWFGSRTHSQIYLWTGIWNMLVSPHQEVGQATLRVHG